MSADRWHFYLELLLTIKVHRLTLINIQHHFNKRVLSLRTQSITQAGNNMETVEVSWKHDKAANMKNS